MSEDDLISALEKIVRTTKASIDSVVRAGSGQYEGQDVWKQAEHDDVVARQTVAQLIEARRELRKVLSTELGLSRDEVIHRPKQNVF